MIVKTDEYLVKLIWHIIALLGLAVMSYVASFHVSSVNADIEWVNTVWAPEASGARVDHVYS